MTPYAKPGAITDGPSYGQPELASGRAPKGELLSAPRLSGPMLMYSSWAPPWTLVYETPVIAVTV